MISENEKVNDYKHMPDIHEGIKFRKTMANSVNTFFLNIFYTSVLLNKQTVREKWRNRYEINKTYSRTIIYCRSHNSNNIIIRFHIRINGQLWKKVE